MIKKEIKTVVEEYHSVDELTDLERGLIERAKEAAMNAYAPYSCFHVGAALLLEDDQIVTGNNQENAAYPSGLCAERVALFYANAEYPEKKVKTIAIAAMKNNELINEPVPPCGSCRQAILETSNRFTNKIRIILVGKDRIQVVADGKELLPLSFNEKFIK